MWSVLCLVAAAVTVWATNEDAILGKGQWMVDSFAVCPDADKYPCRLDIKKRKMNRTHDTFSVTMYTPDEINEYSHGIYIEVCKKVDGGCKLQYTFNEPSFCNFAKKYAEENFCTALSMAGMENPDCPIPKGDLDISDFLFNYMELPEDGLLGEFMATCYMTKNGENVACGIANVKFIEKDDCDE